MKVSKMKKGYILGILFFGSLWGFSEAVLGGFMYKANIPHSSVILTVIGVAILTIASVYLPGKGILTSIAALAMLYKFMNTPFFACHLLGIVLLGMCCDLFFNVIKSKNRSINAVLAVYLNYILFALMMAYVFRYNHWVENSLSKVSSHIFIGGTIAALICAFAVPLSHRFGEWLQSSKSQASLVESFARMRLITVTVGMWLFALVMLAAQFHSSLA
jgi:hypothetical protein